MGSQRWWWRAAASVLSLLVAPSAFAGAADLFSLDQLRPGMTGVGRTVFEGTRIEEFRVQIIGVLANSSPGQSLILARLAGGPLERTGVMAGMSGSPVYIDGKLLGAVAYGFPFSKETIAGITPIGDMLETTRSEAPSTRASSARFTPRFGASGPAAPLDTQGLLAALRQPQLAVPLTGRAVMESFPGHSWGGVLTPLALPLVLGGFDAAAFEWARQQLASIGFGPVSPAAGGRAPPGPLPALAPGAAVGVSLVEGDLDISATGTITHIDQDRVYAFGHPFFNLGPTQFPMRKAYIYSVFPSLYQSWKIAVPAESVGTIDQDRTTAISGRLGRPPRMIPVEVTLGTSRGRTLHFSFRIVDDELFTPALAYLTLASVLQSQERATGTATVRVDAAVRLAGGREVRVGDVFAREQPGQQAAALVAAPLAYLLGNDFEPVKVEKIEVDISSLETVQTAVLERAWFEHTGPFRPGSTVALKIALATRRSGPQVETIPVTIPPSIPRGEYTLLVADGSTLSGIEQKEMRQPFVPRSLAQLLRALNKVHRSHHIYLRLLHNDRGAVVAGEALRALPPSLLSVLGSREDERDIPLLPTASVWETDLATEFVVTGSRRLTVTVAW
jgi:hypothetical protein